MAGLARMALSVILSVYFIYSGIKFSRGQGEISDAG